MMVAVQKMNPVSHILCWVDGSAEACRAAEYAARLASSLGADLSFVAIGEESERSDGFDEYARIEGISEPPGPLIETDARKCLSQAMKIASDVGVPHAEHLTRSGDAVPAICNAAQAQGADLVVVRNRNAGKLARFLGQSEAEELAAQCDFAVLSVR